MSQEHDCLDYRKPDGDNSKQFETMKDGTDDW